MIGSRNEIRFASDNEFLILDLRFAIEQAILRRSIRFHFKSAI